MRITLIYPTVGRKPGQKYIKSWQMEPLAIAVLAGLTPEHIDLKFYDDRLEEIPYDEETDLVGISVETFSAKRAYEIAYEFKKRDVKVVMGGYHPTLIPDEVQQIADAIVVGEAEEIWPRLVADAEKNQLKKIYKGNNGSSLKGLVFDKSIFNGKRYFKLSLVETGRGCRFACNFCSITSFYKGQYRRRPTNEIVEEIKSLNTKYVFFVDDNIIADLDSAKALFRALIPLKIVWLSQASVNITQDPELLDLMVKSGCTGLLIGFESLNKENLALMNKNHNAYMENYEKPLRILKNKGIVLYGAFVIGYDYDDEDSVSEIVEFSIKQKLFLSAINHLLPFPGTPLYDSFKKDNRLLYKRWWLDKNYHFSDVPFQPKNLSPDRIRELCLRGRRNFYGLRSILKRSLDFRANCASLKAFMTYLSLNLLLGKEVNQKKGMPLGCRPELDFMADMENKVE